MIRKIFIAAAILLCLALLYQHNTNPKVIISRLMKNGQIPQGELKYKVYLLGVIPVGEADFKPIKSEEYNQRKAYHLSATANTLEAFSFLFNGRIILDSYIDAEDFNPIVFRQKLSVMGKENLDSEIMYDQKQQIMTIAGVKRQILPNTQDPLSLVFNIRRIDFDKVQAFEMYINTNQKNYVFQAVARPQDLSINDKEYKTELLKASIRRKDKNRYHQSQVTMVLLKERENLPILIKVFAGGFLMHIKLVDIK